jgi:integrase
VATDDGQPSARKNLGFSRAPLGRLQRQARNISAPATDAAAATLRTSAGHRNSWTKFCATNDLPALPSTPEAVGFFVASCADRGLAPSYIRALLATIRRDHDATGAEVPGLTELAGEVLDAYSRSGGDFRVRKAPILTIRELEAMAQRTIDGPVGRRFQGDREQGAARDRLIVTLGYAGAMRADDLRRSHLDDIERTPWGAVLRLRSSKDNQSGARAESVLVLRREGPLDPIAALDSFHACTGLSSGPLLPSRFGIDPAQPVGRNHVRDRIAAIAAAAGVTKSPTAHSLRRSWATHAYEAGIDLVTIQRHLRHANVTDTKGYVDSLSVWIDNPAADLTTSLIAPSERISTDRGADR